jgi:hypothetical protein
MIKAIKLIFSKKFFVLSILLIIFFVTRLIYLDADIPTFKLLLISGPDELYCNIAGFNLFHYGTWVHKVFDFLPPDELPFTALQNFLTFLGLELFGNNFYGLRISPVICGAIVTICVMYVLNSQIKQDDPEGILPVVAIGIYMLFDFFFLASNRFNEPTIFSMPMITLAMAALTVIDKQSGKSLCYGTLFCGILAGFSFTFVYIYNVYWASALAVTVFLSQWKKGSREIRYHTLLFAFGALISFVCFLVFLDKAYNMTLIYYISLMKGIGGRGTNRVPQMANFHQFITLVRGNWKIAFQQFVTNNLFLYNPGLLFIFLSAVPIFVAKAVRERRTVDVFILLFFAFRICMSIMIPYDLYQKKLVQMFPCVVYTIGAAMVYSRSMIASFPKRKKRLLVAGYSLVAVGGAVLTYRVITSDLGNLMPPYQSVVRFEFLGVLMTFPLILLKRTELRKIGIVVLLLLTLWPNLSLSERFFYGHPTYKRRDALLSMSPKLDGKILAGGVSFATRLYNTSTPVMNLYNYYYYGEDEYDRLLVYLCKSGTVDGGVFYSPSPANPRHFAYPTWDFMRRAGLSLDSEYDLGEDDNLNYSLFVVPGK